MLPADLFSTVLDGMTRNRKRSLLTTLGIVIGVAAVVLMVSLGRSFRAFVFAQIASIGPTTIDVFPKGFVKFGGNLDTLSEDDADAIARLSTVRSVTPVIVITETVTVGREDERPMVLGAGKEVFANYGLTLDRGRLLDDGDEAGGNRVVVLSPTIAEKLFGDRDPVGERVTIGAGTFTVIGVLRPIGSRLLQNLDQHIYMPFSAAKALTGLDYVNFINLRARDDTELAKADVTALLRQRHRIKNPEDDPDKDDFLARAADQVMAILNSVTLGLTIFLALIAGISLLVGGIGIMNIMLVSVSERTREIGLRKALGARGSDILLQFLLEAVSLTLAGGLIGILLGGGFGWALARIAARFLGAFPYTLSLSAVALAVGMAVSTGLLFGIYPAKRAAALHPIEALRYE